MGQGRSGNLGSRLLLVLWVVWLWLASGGLVPAGTPPLPVIPATNFNITNFGAFGNGVSNNATAIQSAINAAGAAGGGTVIVAAVGVLTNYLSGPFNLTNSVGLQINGGTKLQMLPKSSWPSASTPFINGTNLHDVAISGSGTIDGQGAGWWPGGGTRPYLVNISTSTRVLIQNITAQNPPMYHLALMDGNVSVTVQGVTVNTVSSSPNTDGIDLGATNCLIRNCFISGGDDNISLKPGSAVSADIVISNCTFGSGHGVSIGSSTTGGVQNMTVNNCTFNGTDYGIRMKSDRDRGGLVQNLTYSDISMTNVKYPIVIYSYYNSIGTPSGITPFRASTDVVHSVTSATPIWRNISISNVTATATTGNNIVGIIWGLPEMLVSNVTLSKVNLAAPTKTFCIYNAQGIQIVDSNLSAPNTTTNTLTVYNAQITVTNSAPNTNWETITGLGSPSNSVLSLFNGQAGMGDASILGANPLLTLAGSTLTVSNNMSVGSSSSLNFGLGTNVTRTVVTGNLTLGGTLNVADGGGFTNTTYALFTYGGALAYNGLTVGTTPNASFTYTVFTSTAGQVNLVVSGSAPPVDPFVTWQLRYFNCTNLAICPQAAGNADPDGDGMSNTNEFLAGTDPTNGASAFRVVSIVTTGSDLLIDWMSGVGKTNALQWTAGTGDGSYQTNAFADLFIVTNTVGTTTNYLDAGGATNFPARYYRVRLVP
jgi:polygalacturonase